MTHSTLVTKTIPHHNKFHSRGDTKISRVIVHHWASTSGGDTSLADPNRNASVNYFVYSDGTVGVQVPEEYRAWTSGGPAADLPSITIETQNSSTQVFNGNNDDPRSWAVSDKALATLAKLIADIGRRYGWGTIDRTRVRGHREFDSTACPGGYLWHRLADIATDADKQLKGTKPSPVLPEEEDEDMAEAHSMQAKIGGKTTQCIYDRDGFITEWVGGNETYNENIRKQHGVKTLHCILTESHYNAVKRSVLAKSSTTVKLEIPEIPVLPEKTA